MRDMQMDKTELGCLRAIVLFNPGTHSHLLLWLMLFVILSLPIELSCNSLCALLRMGPAFRHVPCLGPDPCISPCASPFQETFSPLSLEGFGLIHVCLLPIPSIPAVQSSGALGSVAKQELQWIWVFKRDKGMDQGKVRTCCYYYCPCSLIPRQAFQQGSALSLGFVFQLHFFFPLLIITSNLLPAIWD